MAVDGETLGLALSGGGYRATLFGPGALWRLNDAGLLTPIKTVGDFLIDQTRALRKRWAIGTRIGAWPVPEWPL